VNLLLASTQYGAWTPPLYSNHGGSIDRLIDVIHVFMFVIFVPWALFFVHCLTKYRAREGHKATYAPIKAKVSKYAEVAVAVFEAFLLLGMSMPVWADYKNNPPASDQRLDIRVVSQQFQWNFHYAGPDGKFGPTNIQLVSASNPIGLVESDAAAADDIVLVNECHLPVDKPIYLRLTSMDVIHSFDIPTMRVKQDVIPGMEIPIWFRIDKSATTDAIRPQMKMTVPMAKAEWYKIRHHVAAVDHKVKDEVVLAKGADLGVDLKKGNELLEQLRKKGLTELTLEPRNPLEIVCAQLCGNSHFKMKAQVMTHTLDEFTKWVAESSKKQKLETDF
jgi:cytochrome c oxidase subunit II